MSINECVLKDTASCSMTKTELFEQFKMPVKYQKYVVVLSSSLTVYKFNYTITCSYIVRKLYRCPRDRGKWANCALVFMKSKHRLKIILAHDWSCGR